MNPSRVPWIRTGFLAVLLAGQATAAPPQSREPGPKWHLSWSDEFDQPDGTAPDPAHWVADLGGNGWGNNELQTYTARRENARIEKGRLVIEARREPFAGPDKVVRDFTSARLKTLGRLDWKWGRFEARMKLPRGQGIWPAFWTMGTNLTTAGWPACGEIDILENIGREPTQVHGTLHGPGYSGGGGIGKGTSLPTGAPFTDDFHLYAVEWTHHRIRWSVDGRTYFTLTPADLPKDTDWVFEKSHFLLLNLAVGGNWPGKPDSTTVFPQRFEIDYVRVYAEEAPVTTATSPTGPAHFPEKP
jgi:beta-glucanase (GH16 family)